MVDLLIYPSASDNSIHAVIISRHLTFSYITYISLFFYSSLIAVTN